MAGENDDRGGSDEGFRNLLTRYNNDMSAMAAELYSQTARLRDDRRKLRERVSELEKQVPAEGTVVLNAEQAAEFKRYKELGTPNEVNSKIEEAGKAEREELSQLKHRLAVGKAATAMGYRENVLERLLKSEQLQLELEEDREGQTNVLIKRGDEKAVPLSEFAEQNWSDFLPSLRTQEDSGADRQQQQDRVGAARQVGGRRQGGDPDYVGDYIKNYREARTKQQPQ